MSIKLVIDKEIVFENYLTAILYGNGIIEIIWDASIVTIEVKHLAKMQEAVFELGKGQKKPLYFTMHEFLDITPEARKYATSTEGIKYTLGTTVLIDNLAKKLLFNFFMNVNKPKVPTKGFTNREDCIIWLEKIQADSNL